MKGPVFDRRTFTLEAALAVLGGVTISISGCRGTGSPMIADPAPLPTPTPTPTPTPLMDKTGVFLANHNFPHAAVITAAQLMAGDALRLDIRGASNHPHILDLSAEEIAAIANDRQISKVSSEQQGHTHHVTFN
jgi:hypothetical protein